MPIKTLSGDPSGRKMGYRIFSLATAAVIAVSSSLVVFASDGNKEVKIIDGLKSQTVSTEMKDPAQIVAEAGYILDVNDKLDLDRFSEKDGGVIVIKRAQLIRIDEGGIITYILGYEPSGSDTLVSDDTDSEVSKLEDSFKSQIKQAFTVTVKADGKSKKFAFSGGTVREALKKAGVKVSKDDIVSPSLDSIVTGKTKITVSRVVYRMRNETEVIAHETKMITSPDLKAGETKVSTKGKDGKKSVLYLDKYVNGELVSSSVKKEVTLVKPVTEVIMSGAAKSDSLSDYYGSSVPISELEAPSYLSLNSNGAPSEYKYCIEGKATAYTGDPITATGIVPKPGYIAVDPKQIPYGTECYVTSADGKYVYGYCIAADTGGFVKMGNTTIDLFMNTEDMCLDWGNRRVNIYVL